MQFKRNKRSLTEAFEKHKEFNRSLKEINEV